MSDAEKPPKDRRYAMLAIGLAAQDAQFGLGYVENQIPLLVRAMGDPRTPPQPPVDARP